jgi:nucleotide-binding universal stress UspA family protein
VAERREASIIAVGSGHHGPVGRLVLGSVTAETLRRAPCAVAVAPRGWAEGPRSLARIGVAVDGSERDRSAIAFATSLAQRVHPRAAVQTIHVEASPRHGAGQRLDAVTLLTGEPADALASHSAALDILVLGSRGRGGLGSVVLGGVAARLIGIARCPVVALPSDAGTTVPADAAAPGATSVRA